MNFIQKKINSKILIVLISLVLGCLVIYIIFVNVIGWNTQRFSSFSKYKEYSLYKYGPKDNNGLSSNDEIIDENMGLTNNSKATYFLFLPEKQKATGQFVIVCPGGGYSYLSTTNEGIKVAEWLRDNGIANLVLMYRMPNYKYHNIPLEDVQESIKLVRKNAKKWNIDSNRVGIMGFSAGGHLAATASNNYDNSTRPNFTILFYPVITMKNEYTHYDSKLYLLGNKESKLTDFYSNELRVTSNTPPTFIAYTEDDKIVNPKNSKLYYDALVKNKVPAVIYSYPKGGHGWGWDSWFSFHSKLCDDLLLWLKKF